MAWTSEQSKAIFTRGKNIIVSAGAGSGKTAVLSERILQYCLDGGDIRRILVLTFTNAAALEMKQRITQKLTAANLKEQADAVEQAFITTFDAYSLSFVKKYAYELNLEPNIGIMDPSFLQLKRKQLTEGLFTQLYSEQHSSFFHLLKNYARQDDKMILEVVVSLVKQLDLIVDEERFCSEYEEKYFCPDFVKRALDRYEQIALKEFRLLAELLSSLDHDFFAENIKGWETLHELTIQSLQVDSYEDAFAFFQNRTLPKVSPTASEALKERKKECGNCWKEVKERYFSKYLSKEEMKEEYLSTKEDVLYLLSLAKQVYDRFKEYKKELLMFDYPDIAKMALYLVCNFERIHQEVSQSFDEILIDEYQDTSDLQEAFIQAISRQNCYMVGDLKQSIYRFRNANPSIFQKKYQSFKHSEQGVCIDLNMNFRSRKEVIEDFNLIFNRLMTEEMGDADYQNEHQMQFGLQEYEKTPKKWEYHMELLKYHSTEEFTEEEQEAFLCGREIMNLMKRPPLVFSKGEFRPLAYHDIAILIDKTNSFATFKKVFEYLGIPLSIEADMDLNQSILPKLFSNILLVLSQLNGEKDTAWRHALASVARSFIYSYTDEMVYDLIVKGKSFPILDDMEELNRRVGTVSYETLFFDICEKTDLFSKLTTIGDVENSLVVLEYIYQIFSTISKVGMDMDSASRYFISVFEEKIDLKYQVKTSASDSVRLMTIHKSKGLEFSYCFFPMLFSSFNTSDQKKKFGFSSEWGIYIPSVSEGLSDTFIKTLATDQMSREDISEKVRLFYVALTRTREKFYLITNADKENPNGRWTSFQRFTEKLNLDEFAKEVQESQLGLTKEYRKTVKSDSRWEGEERTYSWEMKSWAINHSKRISKKMEELMSDSLKNAVELGLEFHECLEVLDFNHPQIEELPVSDFMKKTLKKVLQHPVFQKISSAKTYHEYEFYLEKDEQSYQGIIDLLAVYEDHIDIIDYKLSSVSHEEYQRQLKIYADYVASVSSKKIHCYLVSILNQTIREVPIDA